MQFSKANYRVFSIILFGFLLFGLKEFAELLYHPLQSTIAFIGLLFIFVSPFFFRYKRDNPLKGKIRIVFNAYLLWTFLIITRPFLLGQDFSEDSLHPYKIYGLTSYLLPLIILLGTRIISLPKLFKMIFVFSIIGYVFFVLNFSTMQIVVLRGEVMSTDGEMGLASLADQYNFWFTISCFSMLCYEFVPKKYKWFAIFTSLFILFLFAFLARRGGVVIIALYFFGMFYLYLQQSKSRNVFLKFVFIGVIISIIFVTVNTYSNSTFSLLFNRINEDTRSDVDETLIKYLTTENAWLFGEGIEGAYKHPAFDVPRYTHETGYLYLILKGGIIYLIFYVFLLLHAFYVGFFKTRNRLTKALALYVFFHVVFLIPYGLPSFGLEYLFVWIAFALCESLSWRSMTNEQVKYYLAKI
ncbi:hypothetical protein [Flavobacterium maritimum]|uniref:hypothetical protein n=1 Tax=Flavobacterium maritimum TaxID=3149042 RepID=UPI0032B33D57